MNKNQALAELVNETGGYTRSQLWLFFLMSIVTMISGQNAVQIIFLAKNLPHRCKVAACDADNSSFVEDFLNFTTPFDEKTKTWDSCHTYSGIGKDNCEKSYFDNSQIIKCSEWIYDTSVFKSTAVSEFNLVCDDEWKQPLPNSFVMIGMLIGAILIGGIADNLGRRTALVLALFLAGIGQAVSAIVFDFYSLIAARVIVGMGTTALFQLPFILLVEQSSLKCRNFYGIIIELPFAVGEATVALLAYFIRSWRSLQGVMALFTIILASFYYWCTPESIRWLFSKSKMSKTKTELAKIAKLNGKKIEEYDKFITDLTKDKFEDEVNVGESEKKITYFELFKYPNIRNRFFKLCYCWFAINVSYYGLSANSVNLGGDVFINFAAIMLIEIPAFIFAAFIIVRCGKKGSLLCVMIFGGVSCIASGLLPQELNILITTLSMAGKFGTSAGFAIVYLYTAELFPTPTRAICIGACSTCGRTGAIISPFISYLAAVYRPLPLLVFGILSLFAGVIMFFLPETMGSELPQTIEESEDFGKDQSLMQFSCCSSNKNESEDNE